MNRRLIVLAVAAMVLIGSAAVVQAQESSWIHIRVNETYGAKVNVNLPMSLVEIAMDVAQDQVFDDEHVRIYRQADTVHIEVDEDGDEKVRVQVPFSVVDVLLEGEGNELNLAAALREMASANDGQILQVQDGDTDVNIWIDTNPQG